MTGGGSKAEKHLATGPEGLAIVTTMQPSQVARSNDERER